MKKSILFVDDEPRVLQGLRRMLHSKRKEWDMTFVTGVDEANKALSKSVYDLIISDIKMPGKTGFDLLEVLSNSEDTKRIPVIILTGIKEQNLKRHVLNMGASDLLSKPIEIEDLIARIQSLLRLKSFYDKAEINNDILKRIINKQALELTKSRLEVVWKLAKAAESRDNQTGNHIIRVGHYCRVISKELGMKNDFVDKIFMTSPLHDIGKIGIPDKILLKRSNLTEKEKKIMEQHCVIGSKILLQKPKNLQSLRVGKKIYSPKELLNINNPFLKMGSNIALGHHERWDGNGYPNGLSGEAIPLEARITAIADVYDALSSPRHYKPSYSDDNIHAIMKKEVGYQLDPDIFSAFEKAFDKIKSIKNNININKNENKKRK